MNTMYTKKRPLLLITLLLVVGCLNGWAERLDSDKKKEINQSYSVSADGKLVVDNRYGNVTVTHWNKNEVSIRVVIESKARSESEAQRGLDRVNVEIKQSGNTVYAETSFENQSGWNNSNNRININYYINIPTKFNMNISQRYGSINLPEKNEGKCELEVKYGNIKAGSFTSPLRIEAGYSNINIDDVQDLELDISYCGSVDMNNGKTVRIDSKYSNLKMRNIEKLSMDKKYGNLVMQNVDNVTMEIKYSEAKIERVKDELNIELSYSTLTVNELSSGFKRVKAESRYGNLNLSIPASASFKVNAEDMKYGNLDISGFKITHTDIVNKVNYYHQINGGSNNNVIDFKGNNYSNLRIKTL